MKKAYWALSLCLLFAACKNDKPQESNIFGNGEAGAESEKLEVTDENGDIQEQDRPQNIGKYFTDLTMPTLEGGKAKLSDFVKKNKVTIVDCWASWCRPCMAEMPNIAMLYRKYHQLGVEVVGVSFDEDQTAWNATVKNHDMVWPQLSELKGWDNQMANTYGIHGIPYTIVINQKGEIIAEGLRGEDLINAVAKAL